MFKHLENKMRKELEMLEEKYRTGTELSEGDLRRIDLLVHSLKSLATYCAMKESEEMRYEDNSYNSSMGNSYTNNSYMNNSYNRGRDGMGQYVSRDMNPDMSGRMMYPPMYPENRRW